MEMIVLCMAKSRRKQMQYIDNGAIYIKYIRQQGYSMLLSPLTLLFAMVLLILKHLQTVRVVCGYFQWFPCSSGA